MNYKQRNTSSDQEHEFQKKIRLELITENKNKI
jgi:hypothetical protein